MKTKFNQPIQKTLWAACLCLIFLLSPCPTFAHLVVPVSRPIPPQTLRLPANVGSLEIQQALDQLPPSGGRVCLPSGTFLISQPIVLRRDNQTLQGAGETTVLKLVSGANCPVIIMGEAVNNPRHLVKHLCVEEIKIDGNRFFQTRELWHLSGEGSEIRNNGITIQRVTDSMVQDVTCCRCRSGGLVTTRLVTRLAVQRFTSYDNQYDGLACYQTTHSIFKDLYLHDNPGAGISLDLSFNHNCISNAFLLANNLGVFMRASRDNQFYNLTIQNSHHFGVFMAGHLDAAPMTECVDNSFTNLIAKNCGGAAFRVNDISCTNNVLIRASIAHNQKPGISLARPNLVVLE